MTKTIANPDAAFGLTNDAFNLQTSNYTLQAEDANEDRVVQMSSASANTVTIPPHSAVPFPVGAYITIQQLGAGATTITAGSGVTGTAASALVGGQYQFARIVQRAVNVWDVVGGVAALSGTFGTVFSEALTEVAVTAGVTLDATAFGKMHVCSGTTADYTVVLPAVAGNGGKHIGFRMAPGLTKFVTLDGNAAETIDGQATRIMWAQEVAVLYCDGATWAKVAGKTRGLACSLRNNAAQTVADATLALVLLNQADLDVSSRMADTTNHRVVCVRPGVYSLKAQNYFTNGAAVERCIVALQLNGSQLTSAEENAYGTDGYPVPQCFLTATLAVGDYLDLVAYHSTGAPRNLVGAAMGASCLLSVDEAVSW